MNTQVKCAYWVVVCTSLCLLTVGINNVRTSIGDEHCYIDAAKNFIAGIPSTNPEHPPLVKYIIASFIETFGDNPYGWRLPSVLAGTLLAFSVFNLTYKLSGELRTAYVAWTLIIAGGFWYLMSRLAALSIFELAFEMTAVWLFLEAMRHDDIKWWCYAGLLFGLSVASRWLGAMGLAGCLIVAFSSRRFLKPAIMSLVAVSVYLVTWIPLLIREHRPPGYLFTAHAFIIHFHRNMPIPAYLCDPWWKWLFLTEQVRSLAPLVANPLIAGLGLVAIIALIWYPSRKSFTLPVALYLMHILPWTVGVKSMTFYSYYFEAFTFLTIVLAMALPKISSPTVRLDLIATAAALGYFVYWYPIWGFFPQPFGGIFGYHGM